LFKKLLAALTAVLMLAGCAQLPTSSQVQRGPELSGDIPGDYLYYSPTGPIAGASREEIIQGFLNAATAPQNDYSIAREYLTADLKGKWDPSGATLVQRGQFQIANPHKDDFTVKVEVQSQVDEHGIFSNSPLGTKQTLDISLVKEGKNWRIASAPNLTVVIAPVFDVIFRSYSLYFFDRAMQNLVPDVRWFPSRASTTTLVMNALLDGPVDWLAPGVVSAIPSGTRLAIDSVAIDGGVAKIDLTARALVAGDNERLRMRAQLLATMRQLPSVNDVVISIERTPQDIAILPITPEPASNKSPVGLSKAGIKHLGSSNAVVTNSTAAVQKVKATDFALSNDESLLSLKNNQGVWYADLGSSIATPIELIDSRPSLLTPVFDNGNRLWITASTSTSDLLTYLPSGETRKIEATWLKGIKRKAIAISPEGSRIALIEQRKAGNRLLVAVIVRDERGNAISLGSPIEISVGDYSVESFSWADSTHIALIAKNSAGQKPSVIELGGSFRSLPPLEDATKILASNPLTAIYALTKTGDVLQLRGTTWDTIAIDQTAAAIGH
jgi:hypothetical protein